MKNKLNEYKARLEFWWAKKSLKDGRDFALSFDEQGLLVEILRGPFEKVQYRYANIQVREDDAGLVDFHTVVVYNPTNADVTNSKFVKLTSTILRILFQDAFGENAENRLTVKEQVVNENRNVDTSEPLEEREFYEESTPLLEKRVSKRKPRKKVVRTDSEPHSEVQQSTKPKRTRARTTGKKGSNRK